MSPDQHGFSKALPDGPPAGGSLPRGVVPPVYGNRWTVFGVCLFLAAAVAMVFGQTVRFGFVNFDDDVYVTKNPEVTGGLTWKGIAWAFTHVYSSNWHPLTWLSHMLDCQCYGLNPGGHHLTNVLLHGANVILLFLILRQMTGFLWRSAFVAAVFAVHPLRVESVAWIAERKDVLSGLFFMLTVWAYVRYVRRAGSLGRYLVVALMLGLALMSKPMAVTLPLVLLLLDYWPLNRFGEALNVPGQRGNVWRLVLEKVPLAALSGIVCVITVLAQHAAISPQPLALRLGNALVSYAAYVKQMFDPTRLAVLYPYPEYGLALGQVLASAALLLAISAVALFRRRREPWILFGWLWYIGMLVPVIGILQAGSQARADRYTYLPQIGLYIVLTWAAAEGCARWRYRRLALGGGSVAVVTALIFLARSQTACWKDSESLWAHSLACTGDNLVGDINYGNALLAAGRTDQAMVCYRNALKMDAENPDANVSIGYLLVQRGQTDEAMAHFQKALKIKPDYPEAHNDLGIIFAQSGDTGDAITHFQKALQLNPDYAEACYNLGNALSQKGEMEEAVSDYQKALKLKPDYAEASYNLGNALFQQGKTDQAVAAYRAALRIKPNYPNASYNLAMALVQEGKMDEAIVCFQKVLALEPDCAEAWYNLGNAYLQEGNIGEALVRFQRAVTVKPDYSTALNDLAWELATARQASVRNGTKAVELASRANHLAAGKDLDILDTLAAAYAEAGQFGDAVHTAQRAIELARATGQTARLTQFNQELQLYEKNRPFRQGSD